MNLKCKICKKIKSETLFYVCKTNKSGRQGECKKCWKRRVLKYHYENVKPNKEITQKRALAYKHGITVKQYDDMYSEQNGVCAICGKEETTKFKGITVQRLSVDHCHKTGIIRGLLCRKCNTAIAIFDDDIDIFASAISYLINSKIRKAV